MNNIKVSALNISDLMLGDPKKYIEAVYNSVEANTEYQGATRRLDDNIQKLKDHGQDLWVEIDSAASFAETLAIRVAYTEGLNQGFKLAVKLVLSSLK